MCRYSLISDKQFGFRAGHSTDDALIYIVEQPYNATDENQDAKLSGHQQIIRLVVAQRPDGKLESIRIHGKLLAWLNDYL